MRLNEQKGFKNIARAMHVPTCEKSCHIGMVHVASYNI